MDSSRPRAEAILINRNHIAAVGGSQELKATAPDDAEIIDAGGGTVLPGFNDAHVHIFGGSVGLMQLQLDGVMGVDALKEAIRNYAISEPGEGLLIGKSCSYSVISENERLSRRHLDEIMPDRPILVFAFDHHTAWANTAALKAAGILRGADVGVGNHIVMGNDGFATGELREANAIGPVANLAISGGRELLGVATGADPEHVTEENRRSDMTTILRGLEYCASLGITSVQNMDGNLYQLQLLDTIEREHGLPVRVRMPFHMKNHMPLLDLKSKAARWKATYATDRLRCDFVKMFMDGVTEGETALFVDDYAHRPGWKGESLFSQHQFNDICAMASRLGLQIAVHAVGDGAVRMVLNGYEHALNVTGQSDLRHRVEHIEVIHPEDIPRLKRLGAVASMQPIHAPAGPGSIGEPAIEYIGAARLPYSFAWKRLKDAGAEMVFSTDWPVTPLNPLTSLGYAMTRKPGAANMPDQRLQLDELLHGYTAAGAWVEFMEGRKGIIKPGYLADIVVLSGDIESVPSEQMDELTSIVTICDGRITHRARDDAATNGSSWGTA